MFKNLIIYRISNAQPHLQASIEESLTKAAFTECGPTQEKSIGWVSPRGEAHGALVEAIGGHWILRFMSEVKKIPSQVLQRRVDEKASKIERHIGRKPGKKERKELQEEAKLDLLPMAFPSRAATWVWIDPKSNTLVVDANSQSRADEIVSLLVECLPGLALAHLDTQTSPQAAMAHWLKEQEPPAGFSIDRECELKSPDESRATVRYGRHPLDIAEVQEHIQAGKLPTKLAMTWDDRVSFVLTEGLQLKKVAFLDTVFEGQAQDDGGFDADVAIATGELSRMMPDLIAALGGEGRPSLGEEGGAIATA